MERKVKPAVSMGINPCYTEHSWDGSGEDDGNIPKELRVLNVYEGSHLLHAIWPETRATLIKLLSRN